MSLVQGQQKFPSVGGEQGEEALEVSDKTGQ